MFAIGTADATVRVTEFGDKDGVKTGKLVTAIDGKDVRDETIRADKDGISRTVINATKIDPPVLLIKFGLTDEDSWDVKAAVGEAKVTGTFTLKGTEKVTVPAGDYEAVLVEGKLSVAGTAVETKWWLAEGVGIVKLEYTLGGATNTQELKKYTPGKAK